MRKLLVGILPLLFAVGVAAQTVPLFPKAADDRHGFLRVISPHGIPGTVTVTAYTDTGERRETSFSFALGEEVKQFNSYDLEDGNTLKGIAGIGRGNGDWRLELSGDLILVVPVYMRTSDGFLTSLHDSVPREEDDTYRVHIFNPASNDRQRSILRLVNPNSAEVTATVTGTDDAGTDGIGPATVTVPANGATALTAVQLEDGGLGDGTGKWRLTVTASDDIIVMNLMESPDGYLSNLSTAPAVEETLVPLFLRAPDSDGRCPLHLILCSGSDRRHSFVRIINETDSEQTVTVTAFDAAGRQYPFSFTIAGNAVRQFNSYDLEHGNEAKGITGVGSGILNWHLLVDGPVRTLTYMRTNTEGFLTSLHDTVPAFAEDRWQIATFNPASNDRQRSVVRVIDLKHLVDSGERDGWWFEVFGRDDRGVPGQYGVHHSVVDGSTTSMDAGMLERRIFGDGTGKWRLLLTGSGWPKIAIAPMNLMVTPTGHLVNLSTIPGSVMPLPTGTFAGQDDLIRRITEAGGHNGKVVIWELPAGAPFEEGKHAYTMHATMLNQGVPAPNIAVPGPELTDFADSAISGTKGFLRPVHDDLRAETLVVNRSVFPALVPGDADRIEPLNIVWVVAAGNTNSECITDRDYWNLPNRRACGWTDDVYFAFRDAFYTGKALMATAAQYGDDGTIVPAGNTYKCGDMMESCFAVPNAGHSSGATAIVSSAAFHLFQLYEDAEEVVRALKSCAEDVGEPGVDREFGHGVISFRCIEAQIPVVDRE